MIDEILDNIVKYSMFDKGDKVIVAVSGGPDSICLLHSLYELREKLAITIYAAHLNHCLRGRAADMDEEYVKEFCHKLNIEFRSKRVDVNKLSKDKNISCESAGRKARYDFFYELKKEFNAQKIAIAHNANDQAETILMRIMRGTGLNGLVGIRPVRDKIFVRPLINITRSQIEDYCTLNNLNPRIDKTNLETIYSRNKIRLELIPYIQKNFNEDIIKTLNRLSDTIKADNDYLEAISKEKFKKYCDINKEKVIISKGAFVEHKAIITRIIRLAIYNLCGNLYNLDKSHIYQIIDIQGTSTGKALNLPGNINVINNYGNIYIYKTKNYSSKKETNTEYKLGMGINELRDENLIVELSLLKNESIQNLKSNKLIKYFNYDKIKGEIVLRHKKDGDRFIPLGMNGSKKLKDFFIDEKVIKYQREEIPIICFDNEISWIVGYRTSEVFKVTENTKNILQIKIKGERTKECIK